MVDRRSSSPPIRPHASTEDARAPRGREAEEIPRITRGVFFDPPGALPRGRHKLSRDEVRATQRERLLASATELLAARGYRGFGAGEIATRAGVSLEAFYECFENKDACIFAGYDRSIEVLLERMTAIDTSSHDPAALVGEVVGAYFGVLQSDTVVGQAYHVEVDALGWPIRQRRRESMKLFAAFLRELAVGVSPDGEAPVELGWSGYIGAVYAARQLACDALDVERQPDLDALRADLQLWLSDLFRVR